MLNLNYEELNHHIITTAKIRSNYSCIPPLHTPRVCQQPDLETDRPDQTEAASVLSVKTIQLETGLYFQRSTYENTELTYRAYPIALLRIGVLNWLELRAEGTYQDIENEEATRARGFGPLTLGTKVSLWQESSLRPQAAFMTMVDMPVGMPEFKPDNVEVNLRLMFKNSLSESIDLNYNLAYAWEEGNPVKGYAVSIGKGITSKVGVYAEVFGEKPKGKKATHHFDAGLLLLISPNMQLDVAAGKAISSPGQDYFVTTGFSVRLRK